MKTTLVLALMLIFIGCNSLDNQDKTIPNNEKHEIQPSFIVKYKGALKNMMHKGDLSAKADLRNLQETKHLYAIGAIESLKGEIQIFNSQSFNSHEELDSMVINDSFERKACLLVYASVQEWRSIEIPATITNQKQLEKFIKESAHANNIDINEPFPFLLEGMVTSFDWHVINWKDGDTEHSHEKHVNSGLHGTKENLALDMLGFYSNSHHAIFTHHTTNIHVHFKTKDGKMAGHVDDLNLGEKMVLKLPN